MFVLYCHPTVHTVHYCITYYIRVHTINNSGNNNDSISPLRTLISLAEVKSKVATEVQSNTAAVKSVEEEEGDMVLLTAELSDAEEGKSRPRSGRSQTTRRKDEDLVTVLYATSTLGLATSARTKTRLIAMPRMTPESRAQNRQQKKVASAGMSSDSSSEEEEYRILIKTDCGHQVTYSCSSREAR